MSAARARCPTGRRTLVVLAAVLAAGLLSPPSATAAHLVKDIETAPGELHACGGIDQIVAVGSMLFLAVDDCEHGRELWTSDGTAAGTRLLRDIATGSTGSNLRALTEVNGRLVFFADDRVHGLEPWSSDGTEAGTRLLADIVPGTAGSVRPPELLPRLGRDVFFLASDGQCGIDLWKSDGTAAGTIRVRRFPGRPGVPSCASPGGGNIVALAGRLIFTLQPNPGGGAQLWTSDGTDAGTQMLHDGFQSAGFCFPSDFAALGARVLFRADDRVHGCEPWVTDFTPAGTRMVEDVNQSRYGYSNPDGFFEVGAVALFFADDGLHGGEPWVTDGTPGGTALLADIALGVDGSFPSVVFETGGVVYFQARVGGATLWSLWRTDGTVTGTQPVAGGSPYLRHGYRPDRPLSVIDLLPDGQGFALVRGDGTLEGGALFYTFGYDRQPRNLTMVGETYFFTTYQVGDNRGDSELWRTDGTTEGTHRVATLGVVTLGTADSGPTGFVDLHGQAVFAARTRQEGTELWISDGTADGTRLVRDIWPGPGESAPTRLVSTGDVVYFVARDPEHGAELWRSDGTRDGTRLVRDIRPGPDGSGPLDLLLVGPRLFFVADDGVHGNELWVSDGTASGTALVADVRPGRRGSMTPDERFPALRAFGARVAFIADDGRHGNEPWVSDGTTPGTLLVADIRPGRAGSSDPRELAVVSTDAPLLYLPADHGNRGTGLWMSDGTREGTRLAVALVPGPAGAEISSLVSAAGRLFFYARDADYDLYLVRSDGTPDGTAPFAGRLEQPSRLRVAGSNVFFTQEYSGLFRIDARTGERSGIDLGPVIGDDGGDPGFLATFGNTLVGVVRNADFGGLDTGYEPFLSDGSRSGTRSLGDLARASDSSLPTSAAAVGSLLFFNAWTAEYGDELWVEPLAAACGNGVIDAGEACDDGVATGRDGCCSLLCQTLDADDDGRCDRDDPCTAGGNITAARLGLAGLGSARAGDNRLRVSGRMRLDASVGAAGFDPSATGLRLIVRGTRATVLDAPAPAGKASNFLDRGWHSRHDGREWIYRSGRSSAPGIRHVALRQLASPPGSVEIRVQGRYDFRRLARADLPLEATVVLDPSTVPSRACAIASFRGRRSGAACLLGVRDGRLVCR